jgi:hypothetical protein
MTPIRRSCLSRLVLTVVNRAKFFNSGDSDAGRPDSALVRASRAVPTFTALGIVIRLCRAISSFAACRFEFQNVHLARRRKQVVH